MSTQIRQPAGAPTGGQFAGTVHAEPTLTLEQLADLDGMEMPYDPDDQYGAWMVEHEEKVAAASQIPADLSRLDRYDLDELRGQVQGRIDRARAELDSCAQERMVRRDWGDADAIAKIASDEAKAELELDAAMADLHRITDASVAGRMSVDDMTPAQREQVDATFRHAYEYGLAQVGGIALESTDEAEEFASYVVHELTRNDFDESSFEMSRLLKGFEAERAGILAARLAESPDEKSWAKRMARQGGLCAADLGTGRDARKQLAALSRFATRLQGEGFYLHTHVAGRGLTYELTGGRPAEHPERDAA